ncbi:MAG TPA: hypothetical protein VGS17_00685 [Candidatus Limnocylindria bacterium]|nr:hypothetical protein [Candidatus Limnocylindria bacterium]
MPNTVIPNVSGEMANPEVRKQRRAISQGKVEGGSAFVRAEMPQPSVRKNGVGGTTGGMGTAPTNQSGGVGKVGIGRRRGVRG